MLSLLLLSLPSSLALIAAPAVRCDSLMRSLFIEPKGVVSPAAVAAECSATVEWNDMDLDEPVRGPAAVQALLENKFPEGSLLKVERLSDGAASGGFTWHREASGEDGTGLRGVTYVELDEAGKISYVQEGAEPLFKLDKILEALLLGANKNKDAVAAAAAKPPPTYERQTPTTAEGIVRYLWEVAYPGGATPTEALTFFADDIRYEDFNYYEPFVGLEKVLTLTLTLTLRPTVTVTVTVTVTLTLTLRGAGEGPNPKPSPNPKPNPNRNPNPNPNPNPSWGWRRS